ncbi:DUF397 domain-containing protein [Actinomadura rubrisoli]|uniref:DUF397 domain-containing protein n=2 Tax=Actinomadura rubrisoli TaxID=2530368 RepID=A0A4R5B3N2_9ACTN|nr:DUF397 domain-containing protein [Actinomadura rubrisoli]TDD80788.1 DUF397 domain-containing protein [Actinomadura rubrisoli]
MDLSQAVWRKASRSTVEGDNCVEVASVPSAVALRDSKDPDGPMIVVSRREFQGFAETIRKL